MKYIRTKDGRIHRLHSYQGFVNLYVCENPKALPYNLQGDKYYRVRKSKVVNVADTIEELCDCYVYIKGNQHRVFQTYEIKEPGDDVPFYDEIYGAIWTEKGLIYVAKMNNKGEMKLL